MSNIVQFYATALCLVLNVVNGDGVKLGYCETVADTITCNNVTIEGIRLREGIRAVNLLNFNVDTLTGPLVEINSNWSKIERLDMKTISELKSTDTNLYSRYVSYNRPFVGMGKLAHLGFHYRKLLKIPLSFLDGIFELKYLDLSDNVRLTVDNVRQLLSTANVPKLETLILNGIETYLPKDVILDMAFYKSIIKSGERQVKYIDLSNMRIDTMDINIFADSGLCDSLERLVMRNTTFRTISFKFWYGKTCDRLRIFDGSGLFHTYTYQIINFRTTDFICLALVFFYNVEEYYVNNVLRKGFAPPMVINNYHVSMDRCPVRIRKISLTDNAIRWINTSVSLHDVTVQNVEWIDVSNNVLEYIAPTMFTPSVNIKVLNISGNRLHVMLDKYPDDFERLVETLRNLEVLNLASNGLRYIPKRMLINNTNLKTLDISNNRLTDLRFSFVHLSKLALFKLNGNAIQTLQTSEMARLNRLVQGEFPVIQGTDIDLGRNLFQCSCSPESIKTIEWVVQMLQISSNQSNDVYTCVDGEVNGHINADQLLRLNKHCGWKWTKHVLSIAIPLTLTTMGIVIAILVFMTRRLRMNRQRKQAFNDVLDQIRTSIYPKQYLAFLSFCSEDEEFVTDIILPKLKGSLKELVAVDKELVFRGDVTFRPGFPIGEEIIRCIENSAVTVLIVSQRFCQKQWCKQEIQEAYDQRKPIILLLIENVDTAVMDKVLGKIFQTYTHARWIKEEDGGRLEPDWHLFGRSIIELAGVYLNQKHTA